MHIPVLILSSKIIPVFLLTLFNSFNTFSQEPENDNITVQSAREIFTYTTGNDQNPVIINQESSTVYYCNLFRTTIPVVEFYNDQHIIKDVNVKINGSKLRQFVPKHDYYSDDGIFYSDARVCYFSVPLESKGSTSEVSFQKTILDPRYFTSVYFTENFHTEEKEVILKIPSWMKVEIKEYNFDGHKISKNKSSEGNFTVYSYTIKNSAAYKSEPRAPGISYLAPHLLIMNKEAVVKGRTYTYFNTLADQYKWYHGLVKQIGNEPELVKEKALSITKEITGDEEKVKALFLWVQNNIRYIAFEDGIAGFKPEKANEVLSKKYGDCKGMGNLMAEMIKSIGLDGRLCWLGTNHIAYDYSTPSLSVDNHMIAAWKNGDKIIYLDPTEKYIGFGEIAERIQNRQVLIENGVNFILNRIPKKEYSQNSSIETRKLSVEGNDLVGKVHQIWKGENKEYVLTRLMNNPKDKMNEILTQFLSGGNNNYQITNLVVHNINDYNSDLEVEYDLHFKNAVTSFGNEVFLDLDDRKEFSQYKFDTTKRKFPVQFHFKDHMRLETEINLPENIYPARLPDALKIDQPGYNFTGTYKMENGKINYIREVILKNTLLPKKNFSLWNEHIGTLNAFYSNQLNLIRK